MKGIILAAGRGSRMGGATAARPKCLVTLGGESLLDRQLSALRGGGVDRVAIVTGWQAHQLADRGTDTFHNPRWAETNMVVSLTAAADWLQAGPCVVSYSDIFYPAAAVARLVAAADEIAIAYDPEWLAQWSKRFADPLVDAETFEIDAASRVTEIGQRTSSLDRIKGQYMGLLKFTSAGWASAARLIGGLDPVQRDRLDMTGMLRRLIVAGTPVRAVAVEGPWGEVDTESDLALFEQEFRRRPG